jgi:hypothetical protein
MGGVRGRTSHRPRAKCEIAEAQGNRHRVADGQVSHIAYQDVIDRGIGGDIEARAEGDRRHAGVHRAGTSHCGGLPGLNGPVAVVILVDGKIAQIPLDNARHRRELKLYLRDGDLAGGIVAELEGEEIPGPDPGRGKLVGLLAGGMVGKGHSGEVVDHKPSVVAFSSITIISISRCS